MVRLHPHCTLCSIPLNIAGKDLDPYGVYNPIKEFDELVKDFDQQTVLTAIKNKWLGDVSEQQIWGSYKPLHTESHDFPSGLTLKCEMQFGRNQTNFWTPDKKERAPPKGDDLLDTLVCAEFVLGGIYISNRDGRTTWGWSSQLDHLMMTSPAYNEGYRKIKDKSKVACPF